MAENQRSSFLERLFVPVPVAPLVMVRILFGLTMLWWATRQINKDLIAYDFVTPGFHFKYYGFAWVQTLPETFMYGLFYLLVVLALFITVGFLYRLSIVLFFLGRTYLFLIDSAFFINHEYLACLMAFLLMFIPAHRAFSVDAWWKPRQLTAPTWTLWILRFQIGLVYFFGGVAKFDSEWLAGAPMLPMVKNLSGTALSPIAGQAWWPQFMAYSGLLLDLFIVPMLLWGRTRWVATLSLLAFHLTNATMFNITFFPWFMIGMIIVFFPARDVERAIHWLQGRQPAPRADEEPLPRTPARRLTLAFLGFYVALQLLLPLRPFCYAGDPDWTGLGARFSWHMMRKTHHGYAVFYVDIPGRPQLLRFVPTLNFIKTLPEGKRPPLELLLMNHQYNKMSMYPELLLQYSHHIASVLRERGVDAKVYVDAKVALNGRKLLPLVDPQVNLATQPLSPWKTPSWILPLSAPLPSLADMWWPESPELWRSVFQGSAQPITPGRSRP